MKNEKEEEGFSFAVASQRENKVCDGCNKPIQAEQKILRNSKETYHFDCFMELFLL